MNAPQPPNPPARAFRQGLRDSVPMMLVIAPFGMVFGVVATEAGLDLLATLGFSVLVIAGAAQLAAIQLMTENAPVLVVMATALAVNLRMAMYSASLAPHLGRAPLWQRALIAYAMVDQAYATAHVKFEQTRSMSTAAKAVYFLGLVILICPLWYGATILGALAGNAIPANLPIEFAVPATFIAIVAPMLRRLPHLVAAGVSITGTLALSFVPFNLGLLIAAALAMIAGARTERWLARRQEARP